MDKNQEKIPILFDTDIGSDIDDAVCLAYLLKQTRCELVGITTVTGEPIKRAMLASAVCEAASRGDIPIHSGAAEPILVEQKQKKAPQAEVLGNWAHRDDFAPNTAIEFMRDVIHSRPGEITLLTVGPLTNAGLLFAIDREIPKLLKGMVLMCGVFTNRLAGVGPLEWNAIGDPHATSIVYSAPTKKHTSFGLEVTCKCRMAAEECRNKMRGGALDVVLDMAEVWFRGRKQITFHDPLAAVSIFEPDICEYQKGKVEVELLSNRVKGMTHWNPRSEEKTNRIAIDVNPEKFFENYFDVVNNTLRTPQK